MFSPLNVLVVGTGIAGLSVARAPARRGMSGAIIERRFRPVSGMGLFLPANAVRALAGLGLEDRVAHLGAPIRSQQLRDSRAGARTYLRQSRGTWVRSADVSGRTITMPSTGGPSVLLRGPVDLLAAGRGGE
ncbi:FAD-dependent monooxygenase [Streptomyces sp. DG2A-72]|uniref:FAD-dependent monooxygenase n=1 Tax=Streptomyces sp. DG2A-72 TaxID=3051386 RepID=UPI0034641133